MGQGTGRMGERIGVAGIVAAAAVTMGLSIHHELQLRAAALAPAQVTYETAVYQQEECLYRAIRSAVPRGAAVYITSRPSSPTSEQLSELSTLWAVLKAHRAAASWTFSLVSVPGHCGGVELKVHRI
jgi:hypothetical protein